MQTVNRNRNRMRAKCQRNQKLFSKKGFGLNEVIGIAAGIIIAVVVVIPGLQGFAGSILDNLNSWWSDMASSIFSTP